MRKYIYSLLAVLATAFAAVSCATDPVGDASTPSTDAQLGFYVDFASDTRISFEGCEYAWEGDERLGVYVAATLPTPNTYADVELKDGRGYCAVTTKAYAAGDKMYVYHPFSDVNDAYGVDDVHLYIPARQSVAVDVLDASLVPMVGEPLTLGSQSTSTVYMRPLAGMFRFRVYASGDYAGEKLSSIAYADSDTALSGEFVLDATAVGGSEWGLTGGSSNYAMATLAAPYEVGTSKQGAKTVYLVLAPNAYSGTLTVTTDKAVYTYNYDKSVERNRYYDVNIDLSNATSRQSVEGSFGGGDGSVEKPYLIDSADDLATLSAACAVADNAYLDKCYKQIADIDLSTVAFSPIGSETLPFAGVYDGGNYSVSGIVIPESNEAPCGMFGWMSGATIKRVVIDGIENKGVGGKVGGVVGHAVNSTIEDCVMNSDLFASYAISGGIVAYLDGGKVSGCTTASTIKSISTDTSGNWAQSGGIAGYVCNGAVVENCTLSGNVASMSKRIGGIVGDLQASTVKGCRVTADAEVFNNAHSCGGIVGGHYGGTVSDCLVEGLVGSQGDYCGGISGYFNAGTIKGCVVQGSAKVITYNDYCGGIAGAAYTTTNCVIDGCVAYADVAACHSVGGIVGYVRPNAVGSKVVVANSMYIGGELKSTGLNSSSYNLVGGICGWSHGNKDVTSTEVVIANVCARPTLMRGNSYWISQTSKVAIGGIVGFRNTAKTVTMSNLYTDVTSGNIHLEDMPVTSYSSPNWGVLLGCVSTMTLNSGYCLEGSQAIAANNVSYVAGTPTAMSVAQMTDGTLLGNLNNYVSSNSTVEDITLKRWVAGADGYPVIEGLAQNTEPVTAAPKRVSIIGDSISTFRGYISYNYGAHYPTTDGDLNLVGQTYWWRLIYDYMQNACFERNLAYSGTAVARTTNEKYSDTEDYNWYGQDFCTRFINQQGLGKADIVLIHGGTNDRGHNVDPLAPNGYEIRGEAYPTDAEFKAMYDTAAAATTRAEIEALDDTTFCTAYIKLIRLIQERNPKVKIVCIIGDCVSVGIQQSIHKIATHYGARCVDLLAVNGYNDQTYMPKHDYNPSTSSGCHPGSKAMEFIANKIYTELGAWLEE
ncbi:MAG: hypothetical protein IJ348_04065 [Alistipes sp.]|nr:hypothetical protein [Alistipes sp.]